MTEADLKQLIEQHGAEDSIRWNGLDKAIVGIAIRCGCPPIIAYDAEKVVKILSKQMGHEDAIEWIDFNINGAWVGVTTPVLIYRKAD